MDRTDLTQPPNSQPPNDDTALMLRVARRDEAALREIYSRYGNVVLGLAGRILGDADLAEDVAQEVFVQLWRTAERFDPNRGKLRTMLLTQTHGKCVDVIRTRNARAAREDRVMASERSTESDAVERLPADERTSLELAYFGGNTYRQVAVLLSLPEGTVKARIRSGLRRLHAFLAESDRPAHFPTIRKDSPWTAS